MDNREKIRRILDLLSRRSTVSPARRIVDQRLARVDYLPRDTLFSGFDPYHAKVASEIVEILLAAGDFDEFLDLADQVRTFESDGLFLYALYTCVLHRDDCQGVVLPPIEEAAPHWFFADETLHEAIQRSIHNPDEDHTVKDQRTALNTEPEARISYFREDVSLNTHHWSWHVIFPFQWNPNVTGKIKDRKGEMFYYMHQQMVARYNSERLSNGLNRVLPLQNFRDDLEGYFPHMISLVEEENSQSFVHLGSRPPGLHMKDLRNVGVQDLEVWRFRILKAIDQKFVRDKSGRFISLDNESGIDVLGAMVESSLSSPDREIFGNLHNMGHNMLASVHDPDGRFREQPGVMAFVQSATRDPIFFRWHKFIDDLFYRHKITLNPYTSEELSLDGIEVQSAEVNGKEKNVIQTSMKQDFSDLSHTPFLKTEKRILVEYEHLDHEPFTITCRIQNDTGAEKDVTIRVFMGPKYDETGNAFNLNEQRRLMMEIDKIRKRLSPGLNEITRSSSDSSVTMPRTKKKSYRMLEEGNFEGNAEVDYCTCGWPDHMLVPRGTPNGMDFVLFVMCTNYDDDKPDEPAKIACDGAISYCGAKDQKYPDKKPMGFPFDRNIGNEGGFKDHKNNIFVDVKVKFMG